MLFVLFHLGPERYALEARRVVEIVPLLKLKPLPNAPFGIAGMFLYRGQPVPALDLCLLTLGRPAREHLSTRIMILPQPDAGPTPRLIGLIGERVTETMKRSDQDFVPSGIPQTADSYLGGLLVDPKHPNRVIQLIHPEKLLPGPVRGLLPTPLQETNHAAH